MKITIVGYCGYTSLGGKNFDGKLGREVLPETLLPVTFLFAANPERANESQPTPEESIDLINREINYNSFVENSSC